MAWRIGSSNSPIKTYVSLIKTYLDQEGLVDQLDPVQYTRKLKQLNKTQFEELAKDESLHPKRNQARQKLATLNRDKLNELTIDTYMEISFRYPKVVSSASENRFNPNTKSAISGNTDFSKTSSRALESNSTQSGLQFEYSHTSWDSDVYRNKDLPNITSISSKGNSMLSSNSYSKNIQSKSGYSNEVESLMFHIQKLNTELKIANEKVLSYESNGSQNFNFEDLNKKHTMEKARLQSENIKLVAELSALKNSEATTRKQLNKVFAENNMLKLKVDALKTEIDIALSNRKKPSSESSKITSRVDSEIIPPAFEQPCPKIDQDTIKKYQSSIDELTMIIINLKINPKNISHDINSQISTHLDQLILSIDPFRNEVFKHRKFHMQQLATLNRMSTSDRSIIKNIFASELSADIYIDMVNKNFSQIPDMVESLNTCVYNLEISAKHYLANINLSNTSEVERSINVLQRIVNDLYQIISLDGYLISEKSPKPESIESAEKSQNDLPSEKNFVHSDQLQNQIMMDSNQVVDQIQSVLQLLRISHGENKNDETNELKKKDYGSISIVLFDNLKTISELLGRMVESCKPQFEKRLNENEQGKSSLQIDYKTGLQAVNGLDRGMLQIRDYIFDITDFVEMIDEPDMSFQDYIFSNFDKKLKNFDFSENINLLFCIKLFDPLVIDLIHDQTFKQNLITAVFEVAKNTKTLVTIFN
ncbi:hypothetical protein BB561_001919 [Smittium simulii]|uniref:GIT Spa2 homology (SHD) domain-containing protein n=1 Tax=Smittium simulii TaxID=133385 RepID=A0A2T9YSF5_9FUNG|nr:hypothetical protein BB561_001919 [Smittium simulii]